MLEELKPHIVVLRERLTEMKGYLGIVEKRAALTALEEQAAAPGFWNNQTAANENIATTKTLKTVLDPYSEFETLVDDAEVLYELAEAEDEAGQQAAEADIETMLAEGEKLFQTLEMQSLLGGEMDPRNAYVSINAGAGGTESCDWADMLSRMITRYAEHHGFKVDVIDRQPGDEAGLKSITFQISGDYAYGRLKSERGVHRLVRISPFDSASRRHTSFVALDVTAELDDDIDIEIADSDVRVDTYRASGAGGQHVNTTDSAVRMVHIPTGITVQCQAERSQHKNRDKAMKMLKAKLYEHELDKQRTATEQLYGDKGEIAWGRQIRSYVMQPYTMVKDHRTDEQTGNVQAVLDGAIDPFIQAYLKMKQKEAAS
ncbi:peptide chain release factor 2 [Tichowtungia aerotolerans]|uniref:Peptide chain release factor 2 n=1 Tax=Tichowtungia aerotolerans TaxID=2697043 RepID=A0A6P1M9U3_9BACT|nr:peptide chain release factor 2 [Tichowtungia aerotolerans]QHI68858.1 peptide chain release factor 2 [Tichowtungia aerotolerans]